MIKLTIESSDKNDPYYRKCVIEDNMETIWEFQDNLRNLLIAWSFPLKTVDSIFTGCDSEGNEDS